MWLAHLQSWPKKIVLGCVISPLCQQAESRNLGQTFLANSVDSPRKPLRRRPREVMNDAGRKEGTSLSAHFVKQ